MKRKNKSKLVLSDIKILDTVNELNKINRYPTSLGIYKILSGSTEIEYLNYQELNSYNTLSSSSPKRISRQIAVLAKHDLLMKVFTIDSDEKDPYLQITEKGRNILISFYKSGSKKTTFKKVKIAKRQEIILID